MADLGYFMGYTICKSYYNHSSDKKYSFNYGPRGKDYSPIAGLAGESDDGKSLTLKLNLQPNHEYEFIITDMSFKSKEGFPLKPLEVKFKTK